ncbi:MAG TPA: ATP phosphoribosyltransferase regulatory subunit [Pseudogracilibacillus sp.]|nr:ATP phosphoribosyltransferase regulatory subunit [Pseudogracilibacillus sp.]
MPIYYTTQSKPIINITDVYETQQLLIKLKKRFSSYGYDEIKTDAFERYDLYAQLNGTINKQEMIKTIDNNGQVLVLRPDVTIPITKQLASINTHLNNDLRYFYVADVFRQNDEQAEDGKSTQAGVEYFGNSSSEADAEIIALAIHSFEDLSIKNFKIELGHAGFFQAIADELKLTSADTTELKKLIQAKNVTGISPFLEKLNVDANLKSIIEEIPFLYGDSKEVIERAKTLPLSDTMKMKLNNLTEIMTHLKAYGKEDHIVIDLGLINHMDYYSDMIFQGFTGNVSKPVLMGGRYDHLADHFLARIPASGFAFNTNKLLQSVPTKCLKQRSFVDSIIFYEPNQQANSFKLANELRDNDLRVLAYPISQLETVSERTKSVIKLSRNTRTIKINDKEQAFKDFADITHLLTELEEK